MKRGLILIILIAIILLIVIGLFINNFGDKEVSSINRKMKITSVFNEGEKIPVKYTADGDNVNPPLVIEGVPENAKSLVLINDDPDAQKVVGYTWIHWIRFNIPVEGDKVNIGEDSSPGLGGISTYKRTEYGGPNPPAGSGIHRYFFRIYVLDSVLDLDEDTDKSDIENAMQGHIIEEASLMGVYER